MNAIITLVLLSVLSGQTDANRDPQDARVPEILRRAFNHRASFETASMNCRVEQTQPGFAPRVRNLDIRMSPDGTYQKDRGDDDGFLRPLNARTGELPIGVYGLSAPVELVHMPSKGELWSHATNSLFFSKSKSSSWMERIDVRSYGLRSIPLVDRSPAELLKMLTDDTQMRFTTEQESESLVRVKARGERHANGGYYEYEWEIDPDKGPEIVVSREFYTYPDGRRVAASEMKCSLARVDGRWWPVEFEGWSAGGGSLRVALKDVEFDRPDHARHIGVEMLRIPVGAPIQIEGDPGRYFYLGAETWTDEANWRTIQKDHDLSALESLKAQTRQIGTGEYPDWWEKDAATYGLAGVSDRPDLWEIYVRRWIIKHTSHHRWHVIEPLTDAQKAAARGILDDCRKRAVSIRARLDHAHSAADARRAAIENLTEHRGASIKPTASAPAATEAAAKSKSGGARATVNQDTTTARMYAAESEKAPEIERLFDELKRRLDGLLTSKQADPASSQIMRPRQPPMPKRPGPLPEHRPSPKSIG